MAADNPAAGESERGGDSSWNYASGNESGVPEELSFEESSTALALKKQNVLLVLGKRGVRCCVC